MPITVEQARSIAQQELLSIGEDKLFLQIEQVEEFDVGWIFHYQAARFLETGSEDEMLVGAAPIFVSRSDGKPTFVSYHRRLEESISAYRACGDISAHQVPELHLLGGREGASTTQAIQAIRKHSSYGIEHAKALINSCLSGHVPVIELPSMEATEALVHALASAGFDAEIGYSVPRRTGVNVS